jgi:ComF family protein
VPLAVAGRYEPPLSTAIGRFKYEGRADLASGLASLALASVAALPLPSDVTFVPVPLHPRRLAERGYNQAALVAQELARRLGRKCAPRFLQRVRETERQVGKARSLRLTNLESAFVLRAPSTIRSIVLVDDVVTTGSTVRACAQALAAHDVKLFAVAALAQAWPD